MILKPINHFAEYVHIFAGICAYHGSDYEEHGLLGCNTVEVRKEAGVSLSSLGSKSKQPPLASS
jgi:hypothetical protein